MYEQILLRQPNHFDATHFLGVIYLQKGDPARAVDVIGQALALDQSQSPAYSNHGVAFMALGRFDDAIADFDKAISLKPNDAEAFYNRGRAQLALNRQDEALESLDRAIQFKPNHADAHMTRGVVKAALGDHETALACYDKAIALQPLLADAHFNRANGLCELNRHAEALESMNKALALQPHHTDALNNRGNIFRHQKKYDLALKDFSNAMAARPDFVGAKVNLAMLHLLTGRYAEGWPLYEARLQSVELSPIAARFKQPRWTGREDIKGKIVLLVSEQGLGDTIQFSRYAPLVARMGAKVIFEVQRPLKTLMASLEGPAEVYAEGEALPAFDFYCPLLSLPLAFGTTVGNIPAPSRLVADAGLMAQWKSRLSDHKRFRAGLVWAGSPRLDNPAARAIDKKRSLPLSAFAPLRHVKDVDFYSLQLGEPAAELRALVAQGWSGPGMMDLTGDIKDFSDTAALCAGLDLVIACDTSVAHLAGSLGKPTWVLSRYDGCWRWLAEGELSPWYPSVRLFRQTAPGDWSGAIGQVKSALEQVPKNL